MSQNPFLTSLPVGASIVRRVYAIPGHHASGPEFATEVEALRYAVQAKRELLAASPDSLIPEGVWVDLRWRVEIPAEHGGGAVEFSAVRDEYPTLEHAESRIMALAKREQVFTRKPRS